ncbi:MAG: hypothetical protein K1X91_10750 [Bacteriodetes bacterium]|nr:hypothetical protein [Bacteroidota bacterium]
MKKIFLVIITFYFVSSSSYELAAMNDSLLKTQVLSVGQEIFKFNLLTDKGKDIKLNDTCFKNTFIILVSGYTCVKCIPELSEFLRDKFPLIQQKMILHSHTSSILSNRELSIGYRKNTFVHNFLFDVAESTEGGCSLKNPCGIFKYLSIDISPSLIYINRNGELKYLPFDIIYPIASGRIFNKGVFDNLVTE